MRDKIFFPLALLLVVLMVGIALQPGIGRLPTGSVAGDGSNYKKIRVEGAYLNKVIPGGKAKTQLTKDTSGKWLLYIEVTAGDLADDPESGPHFQLASDIETQFSGMRVRCTVRMKPAAKQGATQARVNYSAGRIGESGWQTFDLRPDFTDFSFVYEVPKHIGDQGYDYFAIRPVVPEKTRAMLVESITFERLGRSVPEG